MNSIILPLHQPPTCLFFFNDTATTEIYTLSLHDALPISHAAALLLGLLPSRSVRTQGESAVACAPGFRNRERLRLRWEDRKSTRLNSSHSQISYAVFCLKKKTDDFLPNFHANREQISLVY